MKKYVKGIRNVTMVRNLWSDIKSITKAYKYEEYERKKLIF